LLTDLDIGEAEVLVLASELKADWVILDEEKARIAARLIGLKVIGTVGILLLAKRMGLISSLKPLLDTLRREKFYISKQVYAAAIQHAGEK
jgi:predicted nucleic acid-binding protein